MSEVRKKDVLLDRLVELEPCEYLSELKEPRMRPAVLRALARLDPTTTQWDSGIMSSRILPARR